MIYTCTVNPAIDYTIVLAKELQRNAINRSSRFDYLAGGKGLNASMILNQMAIHSHALVFLGGFSGTFIAENLALYPYITAHTVQIDSPNRINVKIRGSEETDINMVGPHISISQQDAFLRQLCAVQKDDYILVCGSLAENMSFAFVQEIARIAEQKQARLVIDMAGMDRAELIRAKPYLIKPNSDELQQLFPEVKITKENCTLYAKQLQDAGIGHILLSLGSEGAYYFGKQTYQVTQPVQKTVNSVGAGDSMLAAFVGILAGKADIKEALAYGAAAGAATAAGMGLAQIDHILQLKQGVEVKEV